MLGGILLFISYRLPEDADEFLFFNLAEEMNFFSPKLVVHCTINFWEKSSMNHWRFYPSRN